MKILSIPISVLAHFDLTGTPHPIRFKLADKTLKIEHGICNRREACRQSNAVLQVPERDQGRAEAV